MNREYRLLCEIHDEHKLKREKPLAKSRV